MMNFLFYFQDHSDVDIRGMPVLDTGLSIHRAQPTGRLHNLPIAERIPDSRGAH